MKTTQPTTWPASHHDEAKASPLTPEHTHQPQEMIILSTTPTPSHRPLFPLRTLVVLLLALIVGGVVGALTYAVTLNVAAATLAGLGAAGAVLLGHELIE